MPVTLAMITHTRQAAGFSGGLIGIDLVFTQPQSHIESRVQMQTAVLLARVTIEDNFAFVVSGLLSGSICLLSTRAYGCVLLLAM